MIENLENNEQILLMYLAGELPAADRADVESMLCSDASLRRDWQQLQALHTTVGAGLGKLDEVSPMPVNPEFATRQVGRAMRQKLARPKVASVSAPAERPPRSWWWLYPTVAAASIAIVAMVWLNRQQSPTSMPASMPQLSPQSQDAVARGENSNEADDELLIDSMSPPAGLDTKEAVVADDESRRQVATGDSLPQDEISQYLLTATAGQ